MKLYNIELGDQEFFTHFISIDILWAHGLHIVPPWRKQSMASAFLCGPSGPAAFCSTGSAFATHGRISVPVPPRGELCTQRCGFTQGENVVKMLLTHLFCSRLDREGRQTRRRRRRRKGRRESVWGVPPAQLNPPNVMEGAARYRHGNPASVIFDSDQRRGSDEIALTCFLLSR